MLIRPLNLFFMLTYGRIWLPRRLQIAARQVIARRVQARNVGNWPIDESAGTPPPGWKGWPDSKQFAFVLTHDVDSQPGLDRCRMLMDMEERLGFRSAFNFVARGCYNVPPELRAEMVARGFEVGLHGLYHDWWTFLFRRVFDQRAPLIRAYLKEWGAVGFRAPSTVRNSRWIGELGLEYDSSSFDTDPFEPQPGGANTIFPFWVDGVGAGRGYTELPYTLPQDFTLFVLLQEPGPDVWVRKLAWLAAKGGMALLDVHPDYVTVDGRPVRSQEYPLRCYTDFLEHVRSSYAGKFWHALPKEVARFCRSSMQPTRPPQAIEVVSASDGDAAGSRPTLAGKRALMIVFSVYPGDPRVRRAAEALAEAGMQVDVICLRDGAAPAFESVRGVSVYRVPLRRKRSQKSRYLFEYSAFGLLAFARAAWMRLRRRYALVHVHNMPDALVFTALIPRLCGAKVILDLHDPMPEVFMAKYGSDTGHHLIRVLLAMEKMSLRFAHLGLTPNIAFRNLFIERSCRPEKMQIVMNSPQEHIFNTDGATEAERLSSSRATGFVLMYHGTIVERHGLDLAVEAVARLRSKIPGLAFHAYGSGDAFVRTFLDIVQQHGVSDIVHYHGPKPLEEIARQIRGIDLGIIPNRRSAFTDINFPTRIFEYLAMGKPVIAPRTPGIQDYFDEASLFFFEPGNVENLTVVIKKVYDSPATASAVLQRGRAIYSQHRWRQEKARYLDRMEALFPTAVSVGNGESIR